jgi:exodeoxyribonuclease VII small subunit
MKGKESEAPGVTFEQMMKRLEELVTRLERGDLTLEESIQAFEEGIKLAKQCTTVLGEAEKRIQRLTEQGTALAGNEPKPADEEERGPDQLPF